MSTFIIQDQSAHTSILTLKLRIQEAELYLIEDGIFMFIGITMGGMKL